LQVLAGEERVPFQLHRFLRRLLELDLDRRAEPPRFPLDRLDHLTIERGARIEAVEVAVAGFERLDAEIEQAQIAFLVADIDHHALAHVVALAGAAGDLEHHAALGSRDAGALVGARQADLVDGPMRNDDVAQWRRGLRGRRSGDGSEQERGGDAEAQGKRKAHDRY
jgi:hypothetical protein